MPIDCGSANWPHTLQSLPERRFLYSMWPIRSIEHLQEPGPISSSLLLGTKFGKHHGLKIFRCRFPIPFCRDSTNWLKPMPPIPDGARSTCWVIFAGSPIRTFTDSKATPSLHGSLKSRFRFKFSLYGD